MASQQINPAGPAPPAPQAPPPPPLWPPVEPKRGGSRAKRLLVALPLALVVAVAVLLVVRYAVPNPTRDAQNAMRDAQVQVSRSFPPATGAARHTLLLLQAKSFARNRRIALADLDRVVALRRRAMARLGDVPSGADASYLRARDRWSRLLRESIAADRSLRSAVAPLQASDLTTGVVAVDPRTGLHITNKTVEIPTRLGAFIGADLSVRNYYRALRRSNSWLR